MRFVFPFRLFGRAPEAVRTMLPSAASDAAAQVVPEFAPVVKVADSIHPVAKAALEQWKSRSTASAPASESGEPTVLSTFAWIGAGVGTLLFGLVLGRELRRRYKFNRRTPYDLYAHSGDENDLEFGVGI